MIFALSSGILAIIVVSLLAVSINKRPRGNEDMIEISNHIRIGAKTFLIKEYSVVFPIVLLIAILLSIIPLFGVDVGVNWKTAVSFVFGAFISALAGWTAMSVATNANNRTAEAAKNGLKDALKVSFSAGSSTGLSIVGFALLGLVIIYYIFQGEPNAVPEAVDQMSLCGIDGFLTPRLPLKIVVVGIECHGTGQLQHHRSEGFGQPQLRL